MARNTPKRNSQMKSPSRIPKTTPKDNAKSTPPNPHLLPSTPLPAVSTPLRRSSRFSTPKAQLPPPPPPEPRSRSRKSLRFASEKSLAEDAPDPKSSGDASPGLSKRRKEEEDSADVFISPASPDRTETRKLRKINGGRNVGSVERNVSTRSKAKGLKRVYYRKVVYDGGEFSVGDDVYVKRREDAVSDNEDPEVEECRVCFRSGGSVVMIECGECLGGFHLKCLKPPLKEVPEGDWICGFCEAKKLGKEIELPETIKGRKRVRTAKEKLLTSDLYAAHIER